MRQSKCPRCDGKGVITYPNLSATAGLDLLLEAGERVVEAVADAHGLTTLDIKGKRRDVSYVRARHEAAYVMRETLDMPLKLVGLILGDRDHSTIIHAVDRHRYRLKALAG